MQTLRTCQRSVAGKFAAVLILKQVSVVSLKFNPSWLQLSGVTCHLNCGDLPSFQGRTIQNKAQDTLICRAQNNASDLPI